MPPYQMSFAISEPASARIENLLAQVCPVHTGTTLDGWDCPMCLLEDAAIATRRVLEQAASYQTDDETHR